MRQNVRDKKRKMRVVKYNKDNLTEEQIDQVVTRVKVFLINENNEIIVANSNGGCQLPGGHVEEDEELVDSVLREVREETGIILSKEELPEPFYEIRHYTKNYKDTSKNRLSNVLYYFVRTNKKANANNLSLTESEKEYNFNIVLVSKDNFRQYVTDFISNADKAINKIIAKEIIVAYEELEGLLG